MNAPETTGMVFLTTDRELLDDATWSSNSSHHPVYGRTPLLGDRFPSTIRLLVLSPQEAESELCADLWTVDIGTGKEPGFTYSTLSYAWSELHPSRTILLKGLPFDISADLYQGLRSVVRSIPAKSSLFLWVDAICINQADDAERSAQVAIMDQIYRQCSQCIIWLGPEAHDSDLAFDLIDRVSRRAEAIAKSFPKDASRTPEECNQAILPIAAIGNSRCWEEHSKALFHLFTRRYWGRLWIVQEVLLAKRKVLLCGNRSARWAEFSLFFGFTRCFHDHQFYSLLLNSGHNMYQLFAFAKSHQLTSGLSPVQGLLVSRSRKFTDARDAVYAILSFTKDMDITPDYTISANRLWTDLTHKILINDRSLNILSLCRTKHPERRDDEFHAKTSIIEAFFRNPDESFDSVLSLLGIDSSYLTEMGFDLAKLKADYTRLQSESNDIAELRRAVVNLWIPPSACEKNRLPTWVPDWSSASRTDSHILFDIRDGKLIKRDFNASKATKARARFPGTMHDDSAFQTMPPMPPKAHTSLMKSLIIECHRIDVVTEIFGTQDDGIVAAWTAWITPPSFQSKSDASSLRGRACAFVDMLLFGADDLEADKEGRRSLAAYLEEQGKRAIAEQQRAPLTDPEVKAKESSRSSGSDPAHHRTPGSEPWANFSLETYEFVQRMIHFKFFTTAEGYIGLGSPSMQVGDVVCLPLGSDVPFVVRRAKTANNRMLDFVQLTTEEKQKTLAGMQRRRREDQAGTEAESNAEVTTDAEGKPNTDTQVKTATDDSGNLKEASQKLPGIFDILGPEYMVLGLWADINHRRAEDFWLISECYVSGIMQGEFLDQLAPGTEPVEIGLV